MAPSVSGASCTEPQLTYTPTEQDGPGVVSEAIFTPFASVVIFVLPGSTRSGSGGGMVTPGSVKSGGGNAFDRAPVSQVQKPPDDLCATLVLAHLIATFNI